MAILSLRKTHRTTAEFFSFVAGRPNEERWELIDGVFVMQASPTERHQSIVANIVEALRAPARRLGSNCRAIPGVTVKVDHVDTYAPIPDVLVRCGPVLQGTTCDDPLVVVEVLSPSTASRDREFKAMFYRAVASLQAYLIVYTDERRIEMLRRTGPGQAEEDFAFESTGRDGDTLHVPGIDTGLSIAEVYAGVE